MGKVYQVKDHPELRVGVLESHITISIEDLFAAEDPATFIQGQAASAAEGLTAIWNEHKGSLVEVVEPVASDAEKFEIIEGDKA